MNENVGVVIPAYNEGPQILNTLNDLNNYFSNIFIIDDGSTDDLKKIVHMSNVTFIRHPINLGQGAAIQTGIQYALKRKEIEFILTFDADGQHSVNDAVRMVGFITKSDLDVVLGSRFLKKDDSSTIPQKKKLILKLGIIFTRFDTGLKVTDTHNGLRVMKRSFAEKLNIRQSGMAHASEIISQIKETNSRWAEHPANIYYGDYAIKKGQSVFNAVNILTELLHKW